jgi:hypothetical protein
MTQKRPGTMGNKTLRDIVEPLFRKQERQRRLVWLRRLQVPTAAFEHLTPHFEELPAIAEYRAREREELAKRLDWSGERLALFRKHIVAYKRNPTVANYVSIRHEFPEVEIQVGLFGGLDALSELEEEFARRSVNSQLIRDSLDANEHSIDALCLCLLELLVARSRLPKGGSG